MERVDTLILCITAIVVAMIWAGIRTLELEVQAWSTQGKSRIIDAALVRGERDESVV